MALAVAAALALALYATMARGDYTKVPVRFTNAGVELAGVLYLPPGPGPHPAVVTIQGSGVNTRKTPRPHVEGLAERGVAVLAYDKRGVGESGGDWHRADFETLARDALAGVRYLQGRDDVDPERIGLWGMSQGFWIASLAVTLAPEEVAFVVSVSGPGLSPRKQEHYRRDLILRRLGLDDAAIAAVRPLRDQAWDYRRTGEGWEELQAALERARHEPWYPRAADSEGLWDEVKPPSAGDPGLPSLRDLDFDPAPVLERVHVPFLAVLGADDPNLPPEESARNVREALARGGNPDFLVRVFPEGGHGMWVDRGWLDFLVGPRLAKGYLELVDRWVVEHVHEEPGGPSQAEPTRPE